MLLIALFTYLVRSLKDKSLRQLPISEEQRGMICLLAQRIDSNQQDSALIHRLFYSFSAPPDDSKPIGRWQDPLLCFIAISNLCVDGSLKPVLLVTKDFAKWVYLIRSSALYEISLANKSIGEMERWEIFSSGAAGMALSIDLT